MPGILLPSSARLAMKRPADESVSNNITFDPVQRPTKRIRRVHHEIKYTQEGATEALSNSQDESFFQSQLLRSIALSLSAQGFDGIEPLALESFRAVTEEYILHFLKSVTNSMLGSRRECVTPQDFAVALANSGVTSSSLSPFLKIPACPSITQPPIPLSKPPSKATNNLDMLLGPSLKSIPEEQRKKYVPSHLPGLPSRHTWKSTPVYSPRETDARKLREKATKEGVMAEQALRRLTEASRVGKRDLSISQNRRKHDRGATGKAWDTILQAISKADDKQRGSELDWDMDDPDGPPPTSGSLTKMSPNVSFEEDTFVNCERLHWRQTARSRA